jgi:hypothetical protein
MVACKIPKLIVLCAATASAALPAIRSPMMRPHWNPKSYRKEPSVPILLADWSYWSRNLEESSSGGVKSRIPVFPLHGGFGSVLDHKK